MDDWKVYVAFCLGMLIWDLITRLFADSASEAGGMEAGSICAKVGYCVKDYEDSFRPEPEPEPTYKYGLTREAYDALMSITDKNNPFYMCKKHIEKKEPGGMSR